MKNKNESNTWEWIIVGTFLLALGVFSTTLILYFNLRGEMSEALKVLFPWLGGSSISIVPVMIALFGKIKSDKKILKDENKEYEAGMKDLREAYIKETKSFAEIKGQIKSFRNSGIFEKVKQPYKSILKNLIESIIKEDAEDDFHKKTINQFDK